MCCMLCKMANRFGPSLPVAGLFLHLSCLCLLADPLPPSSTLQPVQVVPIRPPSSRRQEKAAATLAAAAAQAQADAAAAAIVAASVGEEGYIEDEHYEHQKTGSGMSYGRGDGLAETNSGQRKRSRRLFADADDQQQQEQFLGSQGTSRAGKGMRSGKRQKQRGGRGAAGKQNHVWDGERGSGVGSGAWGCGLQTVVVVVLLLRINLFKGCSAAVLLLLFVGQKRLCLLGAVLCC